MNRVFDSWACTIGEKCLLCIYNDYYDIHHNSDRFSENGLSFKRNSRTFNGTSSSNRPGSCSMASRALVELTGVSSGLLPSTN